MVRAAAHTMSIQFAGSPHGLFKWVLSDTDDCVRAEGLHALAKLAIRVRWIDC